jgi:hypothetical protein
MAILFKIQFETYFDVREGDGTYFYPGKESQSFFKIKKKIQWFV